MVRFYFSNEPKGISYEDKILGQECMEFHRSTIYLLTRYLQFAEYLRPDLLLCLAQLVSLEPQGPAPAPGQGTFPIRGTL